jgi:hypothetical protein
MSLADPARRQARLESMTYSQHLLDSIAVMSNLRRKSLPEHPSEVETMDRLVFRACLAFALASVAFTGCNKKESDANALAEVTEQVNVTFIQNDVKVVRTLLEKKEGYYYAGIAVTPEGYKYNVTVKPELRTRGRVRKWLIDCKPDGYATPDRELLEKKFKQLIEKDYQSTIKTFQLQQDAKTQNFNGRAELANGKKMELMAGWIDQLDFNGHPTGKKEFVFDTKPDGQIDIRRFAEISFDELMNR